MSRVANACSRSRVCVCVYVQKKCEHSYKISHKPIPTHYPQSYINYICRCINISASAWCSSPDGILPYTPSRSFRTSLTHKYIKESIPADTLERPRDEHSNAAATSLSPPFCVPCQLHIVVVVVVAGTTHRDKGYVSRAIRAIHIEMICFI